MKRQAETKGLHEIWHDITYGKRGAKMLLQRIKTAKNV